MTSRTSREIEEAEIRNLVEAWAASIRAKDVKGVVLRTWSQSVGFYLAPPLRGDAPLEKSLGEWFASFAVPIGYEVRDLKVHVGDDVAFCHSLNRISGRRTDGMETDVWIRETMGFCKIDGKWLIAHEHESVPFYMDGSNRAALDLKP
jgi:ketosteroid isomerase-like protein